MQPFLPFNLTRKYIDHAKGVFQRRAKDASSKPFFLYVAFAHPHTPLFYDPKFSNSSSRPGFKKRYGNTLAEADAAIGEIYSSLEEHGLAKDTLVFITSDNGPANVGSVDCDDIGSVGPYLGSWQTRSKSRGGGGWRRDCQRYKLGRRSSCNGIGCMGWCDKR